MQKIIFVNRFFYPDQSATSQLLTDLVSNLNYSDKEIHIITSRMMYGDASVVLEPKEDWNSIVVHRCWTTRFGRSGLMGRAVDYLSFYVSSFFMMSIITHKNDFLIAKTDPPLISVSCAIIVKLKGAVLINWVQDLFPEVAKELGVSLFSGIVYRTIKWWRNWSLKIAKYNVVLGDIMAKRINNEINRFESIRIIPNWVISSKMKPIPSENNELRDKWGLKEKFVVGYSGNLGRAHDIDTIYSSILALKKYKDIVFLFIGGGAGYDEIRIRAFRENIDNVVFKPYQDASELAYSLSLPDVHIVSLKPELEGLIVPSKFYGILSVARPIIFIGDKEGEISLYLKKWQCGLSIIPGDVASFVESILQLKDSEEYYERMSAAAFNLYQNKFSIGKSIGQWRSVLNS